MNTNPILTFSPDGGQHVYAMSLTGSLVPWLVGVMCALLVGLALALVEVTQLVTSLLHTVMTMDISSFVRLAVFLLLVLITSFVVRFWRASPRNASFQKIGA